MCTPETLQDLLRFLRHDTTRERPIMMMLHTWDVVGNDILPMIQAYHSGAAELILDAGVHTLFFSDCSLALEHFCFCSQTPGLLDAPGGSSINELKWAEALY